MICIEYVCLVVVLCVVCIICSFGAQIFFCNKIIFLKTNSLSYMHRGYFFMFCHYFYLVFYVVKHLRVIFFLDRTLYKSWYIILQPSDNDNIEHKTQGEKQSRKPKRRATRKVCRYFEMNFIFVVRCKILISKGNGSLEV